MSSQVFKRVAVIAGVGNSGGTGAACARLFAKEGYSVALIARRPDALTHLADEINKGGGNAAPFPVSSYSHEDIISAWDKIRAHYPKPEYSIRSAIYNASHGVWKPFLEITPEDVQDCLQVSVAAAFSFSRGAILAFHENDIDEKGNKGTLIFTGATASIRGNVVTSAMSAGKHGTRALSQSLAKEFGKQNIHVAHAIIDGVILTERSMARAGGDWAANLDGRLSPEGIAQAYWFLNNQDRSSWTWELDLRPAHEKW